MPLPKSKNWVSGLRPTTETGSNPKDELGSLKLPVELISPTAGAIMALCMDDGNQKYGPYNYRVSKVHAIIYLAAALRHLNAIIDGEDFDPQTGKPHIGYLMSTAQIYCDAWVNGNLIDNRPVPGKAGEIISAFSRTQSDPELTPEQVTEKLLDIIDKPSRIDLQVSRIALEGQTTWPMCLHAVCQYTPHCVDFCKQLAALNPPETIK